LYERYPPKGLGPEDQTAVDEYLATQRAFQEQLAGELAIDSREMARQRGLVALWDELSLALCLDWAPHEIDGLALGREGDNHTLDPWPLRADAIEVFCEGRRLTGRFDDEGALHAALEVAQRVELRFVLAQPSVP
jgi:hypothetical protein